MTEPDWLTQRGGTLKLGSDQRSWFVMFNNQPFYRLASVPAKGKLACAIAKTNNGRRIPSDSTADTEQGAVQAGLEDLARALGWK